MIAGFIRLGAETHRWILTDQSILVVGMHAFTTVQVAPRTYSVTRTRHGKTEIHIVEVPHPACPPPVMPKPSKRAKWAQKASA